VLNIEITVIIINYFIGDIDTQGIPYSVKDLPHWYIIIIQVTIFAFLYDFGFYFVHRLMHTPWLYKNFHYVHHQHNQTISIYQSHFHLIDGLISAVTTLLPPVLFNAHLVTRLIWTFVYSIESFIAHSGYDIPSAKAHYFHHSHPHTPANFGSFFLIWDKILGTDQYYKDYLKREESKQNVHKFKTS